jgi:AcrR family transcriptional regulator
MNRREASKIETKNLILQAAKQLFRKKRVEECTMRTIAARAGVSPASVIVHFKSKIALLEEALEGEINSA